MTAEFVVVVVSTVVSSGVKLAVDIGVAVVPFVVVASRVEDVAGVNVVVADVEVVAEVDVVISFVVVAV